MKQLAHLGRARVRLALGTTYAPQAERAAYLAGAADDARMVQPGFVAHVTRDGSVRARWNVFYRAHNVSRWGTIAERFGHPQQNLPIVAFTGYRRLTIDAQGRSQVNGIPVARNGVPDPRVLVDSIPGLFGHDGISQMWMQRKYDSLDANMILGKYAEAQLILAEVEGGQGAVARINGLRRMHGLPEYQGTDPMDIHNTLIEERRRELFLEARHWADKLRFGLWFPRQQGRAIPSHQGSYGPTTCQFMPASEYTYNPNLPGEPDLTMQERAGRPLHPLVVPR
jgi:hypothetical protein